MSIVRVRHRLDRCSTQRERVEVSLCLCEWSGRLCHRGIAAAAVVSLPLCVCVCLRLAASYLLHTTTWWNSLARPRPYSTHQRDI